VRLYGGDGGLYLKVRAAEGMIGVGHRVTVWHERRWQAARGRGSLGPERQGRGRLGTHLGRT
jgi:hypothetical protein